MRHGAPTGGDVAYSEPRRAKCANGSGGWLPQPVTMTLTGKHTFWRYAFRSFATHEHTYTQVQSAVLREVVFTFCEESVLGARRNIAKGEMTMLRAWCPQGTRCSVGVGKWISLHLHWSSAALVGAVARTTIVATLPRCVFWDFVGVTAVYGTLLCWSTDCCTEGFSW